MKHFIILFIYYIDFFITYTVLITIILSKNKIILYVLYYFNTL